MAIESSTISQDRSRGLTRRLARARSPVVATAALLFVFVAAGLVPAAYALAGLVVVFAAAWIDSPDNAVVAAAVTPAAAVTDDQLLEAVIASIPVPVVLIERTGHVVTFNPAARAMAPALTRGEPASLVLRGPEIVEAIRGVVTTGEPQRVEFSDRVPVDRWFALHAVPVAGGTGAPDLALLMFQDLTPLRRVEEMRADFVANASHELRTPLAALSGFIDTLQGPAKEDARARERFLGIMHTQATRMARLIDDQIGRASSRERVDSRVRGVPSRRRHTRLQGDWSSDVCSSDLGSRRCAPISSPMPAMSCARRWRRCRASSIRCRGRPKKTRGRASGSSASCTHRPPAWRG